MTTSNDLNNPAVRADITDWPEGALPEQGGGFRETIMPGIRTYRLPDNLAGLWVDGNPLEDRNPRSPTFGKQVIRPSLKFTKTDPLVVVGGEQDGAPFTASIGTSPRPRGKKDDPNTPWASDMAFFLEIALQDKSRPKSMAELQATVNKYGGATVRLETGLSAYCSPERVRYIAIELEENGVISVVTQQDPAGEKGCGKRYYTSSFKLQAPESGYSDQLGCPCGAHLRGFEQIERYLPPVGR